MKNQKYLESKPLSILLFLFIFLLYSVVYMTKNMFSSAMATIVEEGVMTKSQTGLINAVFWFVYAPFQVVGGFAADKYSPYKLVLIGLAGAMFINAIIYFNQSYPVMMCAWASNAIIQFGLWPSVFKIVSTQTAPCIRGTAIFWLLFSTSIGLGLSMLMASFVSRWQQNFLISAVALFITIILFALVYKVLESKMVTKEQISIDKNKTQTKKKVPMLPLLNSSGLIFFLIIGLLRTSIDNGIKMMTPVMLMESYDELPAAIATRISSVLIVFSAIGTFVAGFIKGRITGNEAKAQNILYIASTLPLFVVCFVGKISYVLTLLALCIAVMLIHGASPFNQSFSSMRFEKYGRIGTVSGILNATACAGNILASYVFAKMSEMISWSEVSICWFSIISICIVLCSSVLRKWTKFIKY